MFFIILKLWWEARCVKRKGCKTFKTLLHLRATTRHHATGSPGSAWNVCMFYARLTSPFESTTYLVVKHISTAFHSPRPQENNRSLHRLMRSYERLLRTPKWSSCAHGRRNGIMNYLKVYVGGGLWEIILITWTHEMPRWWMLCGMSCPIDSFVLLCVLAPGNTSAALTP